MDLIKKLTGKNPSEYEPVAKALIDNADTALFEKLVKQDDFLFDFIKDNVAKRLQKACNPSNYKNILPLLKYYSPSYEMMFGEVLNSYGGKEIYPVMKNLYLNGNNSEKAYSAKYLSFYGNFEELLPVIREYAKSDFQPLAINSTELLSILNDSVSKEEALEKLKSEDEFEQFEGVKFLTAFGAKDSVNQIIETMKNSSLSENIASEIPYLISVEELINTNFEQGILVLCNIINAIPDIIPPSAAVDYDLQGVFEKLINNTLNSTSAVALALAKEKFSELASNEEYLFDTDRNTKDAVKSIDAQLGRLNMNRLKSLLYDELYDGSDFVFFALDFVDEVEELESLLDSKNPTLVLKTLNLLKSKNMLTEKHRQEALKSVTVPELKEIIKVL